MGLICKLFGHLPIEISQCEAFAVVDGEGYVVDVEKCSRCGEVYASKLSPLSSHDSGDHAFVSCDQMFNADGRTGPRGGKVRGLKTVCFFCGKKRSEHVSPAVTAA